MKKLRNILFANFLALLAVGSGLFLYWKQESKSESDNTPKQVEVALQSEGGQYKLIRYETDNEDGFPFYPIDNDLENTLPPDDLGDTSAKKLQKEGLTKFSTVDEYLAYLSGYMFFDTIKGESDTSAIMQRKNDLAGFMDWPYKGEYLNYKIQELFFPGILIMTEHSEYEMIDNQYTEFVSTQIGFETSNIETNKAVMQRCKELAASVTGNTNQEKMANIGAILRNIANYETNIYQSEYLLFNGKGNCNAFMEVTDIIARYLGIPCGMVGNDEMNHGWNIFIGSDGQIYEIDNTPTWNNDPALLGSLINHKQFDEQETELLLLSLDRKMIELHGNIGFMQPSVPPSTEEQDKQPEPETKPEPEVKPEPETKPEQNEETTPPKEETATKPDGSNGIPVPQIVSITSEKTGWMTVTVSSTMNGKFNVRYKSPKDRDWMAYTTTKEKDDTLFLRSGETYTVQVRLCRYDIRTGYNYGDIYSEWSEPQEITVK